MDFLSGNTPAGEVHVISLFPHNETSYKAVSETAAAVRTAADIKMEWSGNDVQEFYKTNR